MSSGAEGSNNTNKQILPEELIRAVFFDKNRKRNLPLALRFDDMSTIPGKEEGTTDDDENHLKKVKGHWFDMSGSDSSQEHDADIVEMFSSQIEDMSDFDIDNADFGHPLFHSEKVEVEGAQVPQSESCQSAGDEENEEVFMSGETSSRFYRFLSKLPREQVSQDLQKKVDNFMYLTQKATSTQLNERLQDDQEGNIQTNKGVEEVVALDTLINHFTARWGPSWNNKCSCTRSDNLVALDEKSSVDIDMNSFTSALDINKDESVSPIPYAKQLRQQLDPLLEKNSTINFEKDEGYTSQSGISSMECSGQWSPLNQPPLQ